MARLSDSLTKATPQGAKDCILADGYGLCLQCGRPARPGSIDKQSGNTVKRLYERVVLARRELQESHELSGRALGSPVVQGFGLRPCR